MKKVIWTGLVAAALVLAFAAAAAAQATANASVTATATVSAKASLSVTGAVVFDDANPDDVAMVDANAALNITVKARTGASDNVTLTVEADGDLTESGGATIGIGNLRWVVSGDGFSAGIAAAAPVSVGTWQGPGTHNGTQTYRLVNSWAYATGSYSVALTYTLTAP